jgi:hypothetical protein
LGGKPPAGSLRYAPPRIANAILPPGIPREATGGGRLTMNNSQVILLLLKELLAKTERMNP